MLKKGNKVYSDSFAVSITSNSEDHFRSGVEMAFAAHKSASHYIVDEHGMTLYWSNPGEGVTASPLPYGMDAAAATDLLLGYLSNLDLDLLLRPSLDGSTSRGFRLTTRSERENSGWARNYEIVTVRHHWMIHHK